MRDWDAEPWPDSVVIFDESRRLGFDPEPTAVPIAGTAWLTLGSLPWAGAGHRGRLLLVGPGASALFSTDFRREHLVEILWHGMTSELRWRRVAGWLFRVETPSGCRFYAAASAERRKLLAMAPRA